MEKREFPGRHVLCGDAEKQFDRIALISGVRRVESRTHSGLDLERFGPQRATDRVFGGIEPQRLARFEFVSPGVDHLHTHRGDHVGGIAGDDQIKIAKPFGHGDARRSRRDFSRVAFTDFMVVC